MGNMGFPFVKIPKVKITCEQATQIHTFTMGPFQKQRTIMISGCRSINIVLKCCS